MKITEFDNSIYKAKGQTYTVKWIYDYIKSGEEVEIVSVDGYDMTGEFLLRLAFKGHINKPSNKDVWVLEDYLLSIISQEDLYNIIRSGGLENYMKRRSLK